MSYGYNPGFIQPYGAQVGMQPGMGGITGMQPGMGGMSGMQSGVGGMSGMMQPGMGGMPGMMQSGMGGMPGMQPVMGAMPGMHPGMGGQPNSYGTQAYGGPQSFGMPEPTEPKRLAIKLANQERGYYANLLTQADPEQKGRIEGSQAVSFFKRSNLQVDQLREIWRIATMSGESYLDRDRFFICLRLIALAQQGKPINAESIINNVAADLPTFDLVDQKEDPWELKEEDKKKYLSMFNQVSQGKGFLTGMEARNFFQLSELNMADLGKIWGLSDPQDSGQLNSSQFTVASHMVMTLKRRSMNVPDELPPSLKAVLNSPPVGLEEPSGLSFQARPGGPMSSSGPVMSQGGSMQAAKAPPKSDVFNFGEVQEMLSQIQPKTSRPPQTSDPSFVDFGTELHSSPPSQLSFPEPTAAPLKSSFKSSEPVRQVEQPVRKAESQVRYPELAVLQDNYLQSGIDDSSDNDPMKPVLTQQYTAVLATIKKIQGALELADNFQDHKPVLQDVAAKLTDLLKRFEKSALPERKEPVKQSVKAPKQDDLMGSMSALPARKPTASFDIEHKSSSDDPFAFPQQSQFPSSQSTFDGGRGTQFATGPLTFSFDTNAPSQAKKQQTFHADFDF